MHPSNLLFLSFFLLPVLADRGGSRRPSGIPVATCNQEPTKSSFIFQPTTTLVTAIKAKNQSPTKSASIIQSLVTSTKANKQGPTKSASIVQSVVTSTKANNQKPTKSAFIFQSSTSSVASTKAKRDSYSAIPTTDAHTDVDDEHGPARIEKRMGYVEFSNCDDAPGGTWTTAGFHTRKEVLAQALGDAVKLAEVASTIDADNRGFTHYFGGKKSDDQFTHFKQMMAAIASTEAHFSFVFECRDIPSCQGKRSAMVTDASPGDATTRKTIEVCEQFWTATSSLYLLPREEKFTPSPPYREHEIWCEKTKRGQDADLSGRDTQWYATAGHTVLHELTHLDALAKAAGLDADPATNMHGTEDPQADDKLGREICELAGARNYLKLYEATEDPDFSSPDYNAESYAAAATEIYFMKECGFSQVRPQT